MEITIHYRFTSEVVTRAEANGKRIGSLGEATFDLRELSITAREAITQIARINTDFRNPELCKLFIEQRGYARRSIDLWLSDFHLIQFDNGFEVCSRLVEFDHYMVTQEEIENHMVSMAAQWEEKSSECERANNGDNTVRAIKRLIGDRELSLEIGEGIIGRTVDGEILSLILKEDGVRREGSALDAFNKQQIRAYKRAVKLVDPENGSRWHDAVRVLKKAGFELTIKSIG